ncbi:uncharacterized protein PFL1_01825 [Pseudozyma flocculosa PF-1]|uniref:NodB homology domain-containing protein n=1 Tax=Pseudozyma flocculosa TaxID=84751 RepID=A0A5C3EZ38_9BASI|nr:uncharacterized protein PFL1_01825 [Pseudozyma flocculosa PF-1]EPQ30927.1 hypothetical protein PFL1_01825 [Pseudozyma flocculosa PF-1]SPO36687.1 uncharacterized protein PSFLO_02158 [Pseudozyma flocculosa]
MRLTSTFAALLGATLCCAGVSLAGPVASRDEPVAFHINCTTRSERPVFSIALDDGIRSTEYHESVISTFERRGHVPMFFVNGDFFGCILPYRDEIRSTLEQGRALYGSHGWAHPHALEIPLEEWERDVELLELAYVAMGLGRPRVYRFPFGEHNDEHLVRLRQRGYVAAVQWNQDSRDWAGLSKADVEAKLLDDFAAPDQPRNLLWLNHEVQDLDAKEGLLDWEFDQMAQQGKDYVDIRQCIGVHGPLFAKPTRKQRELAKQLDTNDCKAFAAAYDQLPGPRGRKSL